VEQRVPPTTLGTLEQGYGILPWKYKKRISAHHLKGQPMEIGFEIEGNHFKVTGSQL
jgi:hypothetical protein